MKDFNDLPNRIKVDLLYWFNQRDVSPDEEQMLYELYKEGRFKSWDCPKCGDRCCYGEPENWDNFQGVSGCDYVSYPGDSDVFTPAFLHSLCDTCRMVSWKADVKRPGNEDIILHPAECWEYLNEE